MPPSNPAGIPLSGGQLPYVACGAAWPAPLQFIQEALLLRNIPRISSFSFFVSLPSLASFLSSF